MNDPEHGITALLKRPMRLAGWCAYISGIVCTFGIVFILAFYAAYLTVGEGFGFGELNDTAVVIQYVLMIPIAVTLQQLLRPYGPELSVFSLLVGITGMLAVILLQILLLMEVLPFAEQIGMVSVAFLVVLVWFVINGKLGRSTDFLPRSMFLHVMAGLYFGYPLWAFHVGRSLLKKSN